jgi:anti-sigma factor RsiW
MSDCISVAVRERLPEYLHGRLGAVDRTMVEVHLAACAECAAELALIRAVREAWMGVPAVDTARIVRALPQVRPRAVRVRRPTAWLQVAAVVSFVSLGGISLAVSRTLFNGNGGAAADSASSLTGEAAGTSIVPTISFGGSLTDLGDEDLESLLRAVESLEGAPPAEPDNLSLADLQRSGA